jgi:hypothetical protein
MDKTCGEGMFRYNNGDVYIGQSVDSQRHGKGELIFKNG